MNVYENCPVFESGRFKLRLIEEGDAAGLLKVYGDKKAVPFFNSDNCHGDDFYYTDMERMRQAVNFWTEAYSNGWFVRWTVIDKAADGIAGSVECFLRQADDYFSPCVLLRLDLRSDYEKCGIIEELLTLITPPSFEVFGCNMVATKVIPAAKKRLKAVKSLGFVKPNEYLIGHDGTRYGDYFVKIKG